MSYTTNRPVILYKDGSVPEILKAIFYAGKLAPKMTKQISSRLIGKNDYETLRNIWNFLKKEVIYKRDKPGKEVVKSPGKLIFDGYGDCKSFTNMAQSLITNAGISFKYRVAFYDPDNPQQGHIYPIAVLSPKKEIVVDAVHSHFNEEVPFWKAFDYSPDGKLIGSVKSDNFDNLAGIDGNKNIFLFAFLLATTIIIKK
jgi:hypothetical protein